MATPSLPHSLAQGWSSSVSGLSAQARGQTSPRAQRAPRYPSVHPTVWGRLLALAVSFLGPGFRLSVVTRCLIPRKCRVHRARPTAIHVLTIVGAVEPQGPPARKNVHGPEKGSGEACVTAAGQGPSSCWSFLSQPGRTEHISCSEGHGVRGRIQDEDQILLGRRKGTSGWVLGWGRSRRRPAVFVHTLTGATQSAGFLSTPGW